MGDWQQFVESVFLGLLFSFLLAKLISLVITFRDENLSLTREGNNVSKTSQVEREPSQSSQHIEQEFNVVVVDPSGFNELGSRVSEDDSMIAEKGSSVRSESLLGEDVDEDDDWEGVESTELDEVFSAATAFVASAAVDRTSQKASNDVQLQLYGLYKIATEGPCTGPQPSALKMAARAKWQAWHNLGAMPPEDAMQKYIDMITEIYPTWLNGAIKEGMPGNSSAPSSVSTTSMGPVFSTFIYEEESGNDFKMDDIHAFAREGDANSLLKCIVAGVSPNQKDSEGRTPLHWAVDRGHLHIVELLVREGADINAKDKEGQSPLHYAVVCEREAVAELLVKLNADMDARDKDGESPIDICGSKWLCMQRSSPPIEGPSP